MGGPFCETERSQENYFNAVAKAFFIFNGSDHKGDIILNKKGEPVGEYFFIDEHRPTVGMRVSGGDLEKPTLETCQDSLGIFYKGTGGNESFEIIAVADGVSSSLLGQFASGGVMEAIKELFVDSQQTQVPVGIKEAIENLPKIDIGRLKLNIDQLERPKMVKDALREKIKTGGIANTTLGLLTIKRQEKGDTSIRYQIVGDVCIWIIRPPELKNGKLTDARLIKEIRGNKGGYSPDDIRYNVQEGWKINGEVIQGSLTLKPENDGEENTPRKGDIIIVGSDGLLNFLLQCGDNGDNKKGIDILLDKLRTVYLFSYKNKSLTCKNLLDFLKDLMNNRSLPDDLTVVISQT